MRANAFFSVISLLFLACDAPKLPQLGLDYGGEDAAAADTKDDSATSPASLIPISIGQTKSTTFTATRHWRAFSFSGRAGQHIDVRVEGESGLDTVVYLYKASRTTLRPYGRPIASNDDTRDLSWTKNEYSSSIENFELWEDRVYVIVVTTYEQAGRGRADVTVRGTSTMSGAWQARVRAAFIAGVGPLANYLDNPRFSSSCAGLPSAVLARCEAMQYGAGTLRVWRFSVDAKTAIALLADHERERIYIDLLDGAGRWFDHGFGLLPEDGTFNWDWSDDNDPTICKCEGNASAICRGPDGNGFYSGSILCD